MIFNHWYCNTSCISDSVPRAARIPSHTRLHLLLSLGHSGLQHTVSWRHNLHQSDSPLPCFHHPLLLECRSRGLGSVVHVWHLLWSQLDRPTPNLSRYGYPQSIGSPHSGQGSPGSHAPGICPHSAQIESVSSPTIKSPTNGGSKGYSTPVLLLFPKKKQEIFLQTLHLYSLNRSICYGTARSVRS